MTEPTTIYARDITDVESGPVRVQVSFLRRLPGLCVTGLPLLRVRDLSEAVRSSLTVSGFEMPRQRIVVDIDAPRLKRGDRAPTGLVGGTRAPLGLAVALGILKASGQIKADLTPVVFYADLGLDGLLRLPPDVPEPSPASLPEDKILVTAPGPDIDWVEGRVMSFRTLADVVAWLQVREQGQVPKQ